VVAACRERGVLTRGLAGRALQLSPPFVITEPQIARIADTITEALSAVGSAAAAR
jgi:adenosylmethionine-8-amino-7-oxononanoate aminotransferase